MDLREATSWLLRTTDPASQLKLADSYMQAYNRMPAQFMLPSAHKNLKAIIEAFANDTSAFSDYIRAIRDASTGKAYDDLHDVYRTISMRVLQNDRRSRIRKAAAVLSKQLEPRIGRVATYEDQLKIARYIEQRWGAMRLEFMAKERRLRNANRLTSEERNIALGHFWREVDQALEKDTVMLGGDNYVDFLETELRK